MSTWVRCEKRARSPFAYFRLGSFLQKAPSTASRPSTKKLGSFRKTEVFGKLVPQKRLLFAFSDQRRPKRELTERNY